MQRELLRAVEDAYSELRPELWMCVSTLNLGLGEHPESRRRAAHQLEAAGFIELRIGTASICSASDWFNSDQVTRKRLFARLPYGRASRDHAQELYDEYTQHMEEYLAPTASHGERAAALRWIIWYEAAEASGHNLGRQLTSPHTTVRLSETAGALRLEHRLDL